MKSIKIFDEYAEIKKKMHQRPRYDDIEYLINHPHLFKGPDRRASKILNSNYAQLLLNPRGDEEMGEKITNDVAVGPDRGTFDGPPSPSPRFGRGMVDASGIPVPSGPITPASVVSLFEDTDERASRGDSELLIDAADLEALQARAREVTRTRIAEAMARPLSQGTQTERDMQEEEAQSAQAREFSRLQQQHGEALRRAAEQETRLREQERILQQNMQSFEREREQHRKQIEDLEEENRIRSQTLNRMLEQQRAQFSQDRAVLIQAQEAEIDRQRKDIQDILQEYQRREEIAADEIERLRQTLRENAQRLMGGRLFPEDTPMPQPSLLVPDAGTSSSSSAAPSKAAPPAKTKGRLFTEDTPRPEPSLLVPPSRASSSASAAPSKAAPQAKAKAPARPKGQPPGNPPPPKAPGNPPAPKPAARRPIESLEFPLDDAIKSKMKKLINLEGNSSLTTYREMLAALGWRHNVAQREDPSLPDERKLRFKKQWAKILEDYVTKKNLL